jgi:hypothetical protein
MTWQVLYLAVRTRMHTDACSNDDGLLGLSLFDSCELATLLVDPKVSQKLFVLFLYS